jgi:hypothetical protein
MGGSVLAKEELNTQNNSGRTKPTGRAPNRDSPRNLRMMPSSPIRAVVDGPPGVSETLGPWGETTPLLGVSETSG